MSQLTAPTHTLADSIPLGRRITEIMAEKGPAYTIAAMAKRLDINRETLRLMLKGEREIYTFELEKIAQDLKVPVERILQSDIAEESRCLKKLLISNDESDQLQALEWAQMIVRRAIGLTERVIAENDLSFVYSNLMQDSIAYEILMNILPEAEQIAEKYGAPEIYIWVIANILHVKSRKKDYTHFADLVAKAEPHFSTNPRVGGSICYAMAKLKQDVEGDIEGAREKYNQMLGFYRLVDETISLSRALCTVGMFEYQQGNYTVSFDLMNQSFQIAQDHDDNRLKGYVGRNLGCLLLRLGQKEEASKRFAETLELFQMDMNREYSNLKAQLLLLLAIASMEPFHAEEIFREQIGTLTVQKIAAHLLVDRYERIGDVDKKMGFETKLKQLRGVPVDMLIRYFGKAENAWLNLFDFCNMQIWT